MFKTVQIVAKKVTSPLARNESLVILQKRASSSDAVPEEIDLDNSYYEEATPGQIKGQIRNLCQNFPKII
jgi:hypothetical protein